MTDVVATTRPSARTLAPGRRDDRGDDEEATVDTSGQGDWSGPLYAAMLLATLVATQPALGNPLLWLRRPRAAAVGLWLAVAVPSLVELAWHPVYDALSRRPDLIRDGQLWRLLTSVTVQDGGLSGTVSNLVWFAVLAPLAVHLWGPKRALALFVAGVVAFNALTTWVFPSPGGGNSAAMFFLMATTTALLVVRRPHPLPIVMAALVAAIGVVLIVRDDAHGLVMLGGLVVGGAVAALWPPRQVPDARSVTRIAPART
ncbi:rhomboid family intramembrane serine protease [Pseudonocardia sp.]|uniref:rhomboid family intramembrane serine protease n=1 Tax=Pseudonocardia sp. TaxID=60912 RepID=UPI003D0EAB90